MSGVGGSGAPPRAQPLTVTLNVPMTTRIVAVNHASQTVSIEVRVGRYTWPMTFQIEESEP